jgi:DNA ligase-1
MSLQNVYHNLKKLEDTASTNDKIELLKVYLKDITFRQVVWCALNGTLHYHINKFPKYRMAGFVNKGKKYIFPKLKELSRKTGATNADKQELITAASIDKETYEVVKRICQKDLKCGVQARTINKAYPDLIHIMPYQRCKTSAHINNIIFETDGKDHDAFAQCKADGEFTNMFVDDKFNIKFLTRSGKIIHQLNHLKSMIRSNRKSKKQWKYDGILNNTFKDNIRNNVYLGELRVWDKKYKNVLDRKTGNGIIGQCLHGTADKEDAKRVFFTAWDVIPVKDFWIGIYNVSYQTRLFDVGMLTDAVKNKRYIQTIESKRIKSIDEAYSFYAKMRLAGHEGAIIKNLHTIWRDQQSGSPDMIKLKHCFDCDLEITKWNLSKEGGQFDGLMGSITCSSSCGKLVVDVGSGFLPEEREWDWDFLVGSIVMIEAESVIKSKKKKTHALYTPSFIQIREDKSTADSLEQVVEAEKESKRNKRRK